MGGNDGLDSDANPLTGVTVTTTLVPGENGLSWDAGLVQPQWVPDNIIGIDIEKFVRGRYVVEDGGGEGLTPGFWKTHSSYGPAPLSGWPETGYNPDDSYETVFGVSVPGTPTLLQALSTGGGGLDALLRHSTAALLNASNPYVDYAYTVTQVISMTQAAISSGNYETTKDLFAAQNELGADLNTPASGGTIVETPDFDADDPTGPYIPVGGQAIFTYMVKNTGMVALSNIQVTDDRIANLTFVGGDTDHDSLLDTTETWTYTASETVGAGVQYVNTGTATGTYVPGFTVTDSDKAHYTTASLTSSLGDRVWLDANANGVQDLGEPGVANVTVKLLNGSGTQLATQTTDVNGNYLFTNLAPGDYSVQFVVPTGYAFTAKDQGNSDAKDSDADPVIGKTITTSLAAGEQDLSWDAGLYVPVPGIEIVKDASVAATAPNSPVTYTYAVKNTGGVALGNIVVKDDNGTPSYAGDDFNPAAVLGANGKNVGDLDGDNLLDTTEVWQYSATVIPPVQMTVTINGVVYDSGTLSYTTLANGDIRVTYLQSQSINDNNYAASGNAPDWNRSHTFSNLTGSDKAGFELKDGNGNVVLKFYQDYLTATSTNTDGYASFAGYASLGATGGDGSMVVGNSANLYDFDTTLELNLNRAGYTGMTSNSPINDPKWEYVNGYMFTVKASAFGASGFGGVTVFDQHNSPPKVGTNSMIPSIKYGPSTNVATATGTAGGTTVSDSDDVTVNIQAPARIGDRVWCDTDGVQGSGEVGVAGVTVKLLSTTGTVLGTTTTDSNGNYSFNVLPGTYRLQVVKPAAFGGFTTANVGSNDAVDSDVDAGGLSDPITLVSGQNDTSRDAGLTPPTVTLTYDFSGNTATDGGDGNTRSYTVDGVTVTARAVSRHVDSKGNIKWETAWLGAYSGGLGVTDRGEGNGSGNAHTVDNVGRLNYVIFQFSQDVVVDKPFLGYVVGDSDITAWIGSSSTTLTNLSDSLLAGMTKEDNNTTSSSIRWADINAGAKEGNVLVIAASTSDTFKIQKLVISTNDPLVTPIAIDLGGDGIQTVARADAVGGFDLFGNGQAIRSGWLSGEDGFLAVDRNGNGRIDDISELFGGFAKGEGFSKLASYDSNGDGVVDTNDIDFASLRIWQDTNGNHQTDAGELMSLAEAGVASLKVGYAEQPFMDANGNLHLERSSAILSNGGMVDMTDVYFNVSAADASAAGMQLPSLDALLAGMGGDVSTTTGDGAQPVTVMEPVTDVTLIGQQAPVEYWIMWQDMVATDV